jgi:hypothetical protein
MDVYARRRLVAGLVAVGTLVVIIVAIASAGGGDDGEPSAVEGVNAGDESAVSKNQFIREADEICAEANAAIASLSAGAAAEDPELLSQQQYEYTSSELEQLRTLTPPDEDRAALNRFYTALRGQIDVLNAQALAIQRGDDTALADVSTELSAAQAELRAAAADYGFEECGREGEPPTDVDAATSITPAEVEEAPVETAPAAPVETAPAAPVDTEPAAPVETAPTEVAPAPAPTDTDTGATTEPPADPGGGAVEPPPTEPSDSGGTPPTDSGGVSP